MSGVAALYNVPSTQAELDDWAFAHAAHHRDINRRIYQLRGQQLPEFILDPFDTNDSGTWLYQHQAMHTNQDALLGISGYDLLDIDFRDKNEFAGWIFLNADEHVQAANILEIG